MNTRKSVIGNMEVVGSGRRLPPETEVILFRIAQEALHNIRRHARATKASVRIEFSKKDVKLGISDNGCGFKVPGVLSSLARRDKFGIMSMNERVYLVNGSLQIESVLGKGTTITVIVSR